MTDLTIADIESVSAGQIRVTGAIRQKDRKA
jgi:hypothetical protein